MPCLKSTEKPFEIKHHLPIIWTNTEAIEITLGMEQSFYFTNIHSAYNKNWMKTIPYSTTIMPINEVKEHLAHLLVQPVDSGCTRTQIFTNLHIMDRLDEHEIT